MNTSQTKTVDLIDALGQLKAEQAQLAKTEKALKQAIASRMDSKKVDALEGHFFRVVRVTAERSSLDTEEVKRLLVDPPMKTSVSVSYRVNARISETA